jgi:hypothetical protein
LIHEGEVYHGEESQSNFECQDSWIVLYRGEMSVLKYVYEDQDLQKYGSAEATQA